MVELMDKKPILIAFASQKGGVGKTTLCTLFANYLVERGLKVAVGDFDVQQSVLSARKGDVKLHPDLQMPYEVEAYDIMATDAKTSEEKEKYITDILDGMKERTEISILDTPGTLLNDNLITILQNVDYVVTPFAYDRTSWESLVTFISICDAIKENFNAHFKIFFVLNKFDKRFGKIEELKIWIAMDKALSMRGFLAPKIQYMADMTRLNTYSLLKTQRAAVEKCFNFICNTISNDTDHDEQSIE
jgi:chromosome partitioning protein